MVGRIHLVIGDAHSQPDVSNERFDWLGKMIVDLKPDVIVNIGDWASMDSLSSYDKGKKAHEGRRYVADIKHANDALDRMMAPLNKYNKMRARNKKEQYKPEIYHNVGNHEHRITKACDSSSELDGVMAVGDIRFEDSGTLVPFLEHVVVDGVAYCHYYTSGVKGYAISGDFIGRRIIQKLKCSGTMGHGHKFNYFMDTNAKGQFVHGLAAGCYFDHHMDYAGPDNQNFRPGLAVKRNVVDGDYDLEWVSLDEVKRRYG